MKTEDRASRRVADLVAAYREILGKTDLDRPELAVRHEIRSVGHFL